MATESWVVAGPQVIELAAVTRLRVQLLSGRVDVVAHDDPGVRLEVHAVSGRPLEVSLVDGELQVGYQATLSSWEGFVDRFLSFTNPKDRADVHLAVPRDLPVKVGTVRADGLLAGLTEDASATTVAGSLVVDGTSGRLTVTTVSGEVAVRDHAGDLRATTVSGDLAASGELRLVNVTGVSGDVTLDVTATTSSLTASTVSGDLTVRLPAAMGVHVSARSVSGRVVVDGHEYKGAFPGQRSVDLRTGDGGCFLNVSTVSGHLTVLRGATA